MSGFYQQDFEVTNDSDWSENVTITDAATNQPSTEAADAEFLFSLKDRDTVILTASTEDFTLSKPEDHIVQWGFSASQMSALDPCRTYTYGLLMVLPDGSKQQILVGSVAVRDGGF